MNVTRHNYEEFFLLYVDNELSIQERKAVEDFVDAHPELREELEALLQTQLKAPGLTFDKSALYKPAVDEEFLVQYIDNELNDAEREKIELYVKENEAAAKELALLQRTVLEPEPITFGNKEVLYRREAKVIPAFHWRHMLAAASVLLIGALLWISKEMLTPSVDTENSIAGVTVNKSEDPAREKEVSRVTPVEPKSEKDHNAASTQQSAEGNEKVIKPRQPGTEKRRENVELRVEKTTPGISYVPEAGVTEKMENAGKTESFLKEPAEIKMPVKEELAKAVRPVILNEEDFQGDDKETTAAVIPNSILPEEIEKENRQNGNIRGLLRRTSRFINRSKVTEPDTEEADDKSVVRIASFAIAKK